MPDKDIVHPTLHRYKYHKVYKMICEGNTDYNLLASLLAEGLKKDLEEFGNTPIDMILEVGNRFESNISEGLFKYIFNFNDEIQRIEDLAENAQGNKRAIDLAREVCGKGVVDYLYQNQPITNNGLVNDYVSSIFEANFLEHMPLKTHFNGASQNNIDYAVSQIKPIMERNLKAFSTQIVRNRKLGSLVRARLPKVKLSMGDFAEMDLSN